MLDLTTGSPRTVGCDEDGTSFGLENQLSQGLGPSPRGGTVDGVDAEIFHEIGQDQTVLVPADESDAATGFEQFLDLCGAEQGKEDLIVPERVNELLSGVGIGNIGAGTLAADFDANESTQGNERERCDPGGEANECAVPNFHE